MSVNKYLEGAYQSWSKFIGIDWSGAKAQFISGIQVAVAVPGTSVPQTIIPPHHSRKWSRRDVIDLLVDQAFSASCGMPVLVGIDFAFSHPFIDRYSYFPLSKRSPRSATALWRLVEEVNRGMPHFYGGGMFQHSLWGSYYLAPPNYDSQRYASRRRVTENAAKVSGRCPAPTFKAVGADNVSTGSMAGMRLLHHLQKQLGDQLAIWPFDAARMCKNDVKLVLVEVFPSYYFYRVGMSPIKKAAAQAGFLNQALNCYASAGVKASFAAKGFDADEADAIISAATLRYFAQQTTSPDQVMFDIPESLNEAMSIEGWIFGVDPKYAQQPVL